MTYGRMFLIFIAGLAACVVFALLISHTYPARQQPLPSQTSSNTLVDYGRDPLAPTYCVDFKTPTTVLCSVERTSIFGDEATRLCYSTHPRRWTITTSSTAKPPSATFVLIGTHCATLFRVDGD